MTKLYGFTKDYTFPYFCFGKKCYLFKISYSKHKHKFCKYYAKMDAETVLHTIMLNSITIKFFGIIITNKRTMFDIFDN